MMQTFTEQMSASQVFCPNLECMARGQVGQGNIVSHGRKRPRYRCKTCGKTFSEKEGTPFAGLRKPTEVIVLVVTLLAYGCPIQAIVHAFKLDERTVAAWRDRAGAHCRRVHEAIIAQASLDLVHVQADELRVKGRAMVVWMGLAMMVSTRLWLAGVVSRARDRHLADRLLIQVRACVHGVRALLIATDGWAVYPNSIKRAFREKIKETAERGRARLRVWPDLCIATAIKRTQKMRVIAVIRKMTRGAVEQACALLKQSQGGSVLNRAFIERFNGTMRERLAILTRKCRHAARRLHAVETGMYLIGSTYNFCFPHHELSKAKHAGHPCTPAMAAELTNHVWSIYELLCYRVAPSLWVPPKRRGRPRKHAMTDPILPKRPRGRPRKLALVPSTS